MGDARDDRIVELLRAHGNKHPHRTLRAARDAGIRLATLQAMLEMETGGGANVWGHDPVRCGPSGGRVTQNGYAAYKARRGSCGAQGCGPAQLTWPGYQDQADRLGGCHHPFWNILVGARVLRSLSAGRSATAMYASYNGSWSYGVRAALKRRQWIRRLKRV